MNKKTKQSLFKVGDKVKLSSAGKILFGYHLNEFNNLGIIMKISKSKLRYYVKWENEQFDELSFYEGQDLIKVNKNDWLSEVL